MIVVQLQIQCNANGCDAEEPIEGHLGFSFTGTFITIDKLPEGWHQTYGRHYCLFHKDVKPSE